MTEQDSVAFNDGRGNGKIKFFAADEIDEYYMSFDITTPAGEMFRLEKVRFGPGFMARVEKHLDNNRVTERTKYSRCVAIR